MSDNEDESPVQETPRRYSEDIPEEKHANATNNIVQELIAANQAITDRLDEAEADIENLAKIVPKMTEEMVKLLLTDMKILSKHLNNSKRLLGSISAQGDWDEITRKERYEGRESAHRHLKGLYETAGKHARDTETIIYMIETTMDTLQEKIKQMNERWI